MKCLRGRTAMSHSCSLSQSLQKSSPEKAGILCIFAATAKLELLYAPKVTSWKMRPPDWGSTQHRTACSPVSRCKCPSEEWPARIRIHSQKFWQRKKCKCLSFIFFWYFWMSFLFISQCIFKGNCLISFIQILLTHSYLPSLFPGTEAQLVAEQMRELCVSAWSVNAQQFPEAIVISTSTCSRPWGPTVCQHGECSSHIPNDTVSRGQRNEGTMCQAVQLLSCCGCGHAPPKTRRTSGAQPSTPKCCKACTKRHWISPIKSSRQQTSLLSTLEMKGWIPFSFTPV